MATRKIQNYFNSGETDDIKIKGNITYESAKSDPNSNGSFMRVNASGQAYLYKAPDNDVVMTAANNTNVTVGDPAIKLCEITTTEDLSSDDSTYMFTWTATDLGSFAGSTYRMYVTVDGTEVATQDKNMTSGQTHDISTISGIFPSNVSSGATIALWCESTGYPDDVQIDGAYSVTMFQITKAAAAPVTASLTSTGTLSENVDTVFIDCTSGDVDITLPSSSGVDFPIIIKRIDNSANTLTITSSDGIDDGTSITLLPYESATLVSNATQYYIV